MKEAQTTDTPAQNRSAWKPGLRTWEAAIGCMLLAVMVLAVFGQTTRHEFVNYDDQSYVYENAEVTKGLTPGGVVRAFTHRELGLWSPLVTISHMLDCQLYGLKAGGHHLTNVLLHIASAILLFLILRQMTQAHWCSFFVAALFAIHPLRVESVAWIAERKDVLSGLFFMLTLGTYLRYVRRPVAQGRYLAVVFLFALGLMCKPMLVTLPLVLLLLDYWPLQRLFHPSPIRSGAARGIRINWSTVVEKIPLLALSTALCVVTMLAPKEAAFSEHVPFSTRIREAPVSLVIYMRQMIWPTELVVVHTHPKASLPWWLGALALLAALSVGIFLLRRKKPYLWMGWLWNLGMLVPVSGIVQISRHGRADHYNYLPQIGLYIGLTWMVADWVSERRHRRVLVGSAATAVLCVLLAAAYEQTSHWRDSITLWTHTLKYTKDNFVAHGSLGKALADRGSTTEAISQYRQALQINPSAALTHNNLGNAMLQLGRTEEAIAQYRSALKAKPGYANAHYNLGKVLSQEARLEEAVAQYREALRIDPGHAAAHINLGNVLLQQGRIAEAITQIQEALRINPDDPDGHNNLGNILFGLGRTGEAIAHAEKALVLRPANDTFQINLAWMLATAPQASLRNGVKAVQLATQAGESSGGNNPNTLRILAAAYAAAGNFPNALQTAQHALQMAETQSKMEIANMLRREIKLYQAGQPFRDGQ